MQIERIKFDLLQEYASFLYQNSLDEVIDFYHTKNTESLSQYSDLKKEDFSILIQREIKQYLSSILTDKSTEGINTWAINLKENNLPGISSIQNKETYINGLLFNRKISFFCHFLPNFTQDVKLAVSIMKEIEYLSSYQEKLVIKYFNEYKQEDIITKTEEEEVRNEPFSQMQKILDSNPAYINVYDLDEDRSIYSNGGKNIFGYTAKQVQEVKYSLLLDQLVHPGDKEKIKERFNHFKHLKDDEIDSLKYRLFDLEGNVIWFYSRATVFKRENGGVKQVLINALNITDLKQAEEKRRYVEAQLKEAQKIAHIGSFDWDIVNDVLVYTEEVYSIYDLSRNKEKFKIEDFKSRLKQDNLSQFESKLNKALQDVSNHLYEVEYQIVLPDKTQKDIVTRAKIIRNETGDPILMNGTIMDITSIKKAEHGLRQKNKEIIEINNKLEESQKVIKKMNSELEDRVAIRTKELQESEEQYRFLVENLPHIFWTSLPDGRMDFFNQNWYAYTGATFEQTKDLKWTAFIHPEDLPKVIDIWTENVGTGQTGQIEFRLKRADGVYKWHRANSLPLTDPNGRIIKWMGLSINVNEQKKHLDELQLKNEQLIKINTDLDNFIYTASHDLKAPISNIEGLLTSLNYELNEECKTTGDVDPILDMMDSSVKKFKNTILDLTEITKAQKSGEDSTQEIKFEEVLDDVKAMITDLITTTHADIKTNFDDCPTINFSKKNLRSIIYNLLSNSIKFRSPHRQVQITIKTQHIKNYIVLSVKDNGQGFDSNQKPKIFEMFKRLQSETEGSGVGLYLVKRIITNAGGKVEAESSMGKGAEFKVYFPSNNNHKQYTS